MGLIKVGEGARRLSLLLGVLTGLVLFLWGSVWVLNNGPLQTKWTIKLQVMNNPQIGKWIRELRTEGHTEDEIAGYLAADYGTFEDFENNKRATFGKSPSEQYLATQYYGRERGEDYLDWISAWKLEGDTPLKATGECIFLVFLVGAISLLAGGTVIILIRSVAWTIEGFTKSR